MIVMRKSNKYAALFMILIWSVLLTYIYASPGENLKVVILGIWNDQTPKNISKVLCNVDSLDSVFTVPQQELVPTPTGASAHMGLTASKILLLSFFVPKGIPLSLKT